MYDLTIFDYKAVLDLVTTLVNVKTISAFGEMLISSKEQLGFHSVSMIELEFHKTCTFRFLHSDKTYTNKMDNYTVSAEDFKNEELLQAILKGKEVVTTNRFPNFVDELFTPEEQADIYPGEEAYFHIFAKMNKEIMMANVIIFTCCEQDSAKKLNSLAGYLHAHLLNTFSRIRSVSGGKIEKLSEREMSVLTWLKYGKTSWEIAKILNITENTVNFHIKNIKSKLSATNRQHAVAIALAKNIIE
jgi:DNA-binding CsgD family transcriptional regulator